MASKPLELVIAGDYSSIPALAAAYNKAQSDVDVTRLADYKLGSVPLWLDEIAQDQFTIAPKAEDYSATYEPLNDPLGLLNFNPNVLLPGSVDAFTNAGNIYALPVTLAPWCVRWRSDAFTAAGLSDPGAQWTLDDFQTACDALQALVRGGKVHGLVAPLAPMVGEFTIKDTSNGSLSFLGGSLALEGLWEGFAVGFGGTLVEHARFTLTGSRTFEGLTRLVHIAAEYGMAAVNVPAAINGIAHLGDLYALQFARFGPGWDWPYDSRWRFARLPVFPVAPVIPTVYSGMGLTAAFGSGGHLPQSSIGAPYQTAAAKFLTWSYQSQAQTLLSASGVAPVLSDQDVQDAFWTTSSAQAQAVGDWRHFTNYAQGWPVYPPTSIMWNALSQAVAQPSLLSQALSQAEENLNYYVGAVASGGVVSPGAAASASAAFRTVGPTVAKAAPGT